MKKILYLLPFIIWSCDSETNELSEQIIYTEPTGAIKRVLTCNDRDCNNLASIIRYYYDKEERLATKEVYFKEDTLRPFSYDLYYYNQENLLIKKEYFATEFDQKGFKHIRNNFYEYDDNQRLRKETRIRIDLEDIGPSTIYYNYGNKGNFTVVSRSSANAIVIYDSLFYENDQLVIEKMFESDGTLFRKYEYRYENGLMKEKWLDESLFAEVGLEEKYFYNSQGQLEITEMYTPWWHGVFSGVLKYEYF